MAQDDEKELDGNWETVYDSKLHPNQTPWGARSSSVTKTQNSVKFTGQYNGNLYFVYGKKAISIENSDYTKIRWKFKDHYNGSYLYFGIASNTNAKDSIAYTGSNMPANCKYYFRYGGTVVSHLNKSTNVNKPCLNKGVGTGYTITMQLDLEAKTLSFWNDQGKPGNDVYEGIAFDNIDFDSVKQYYVAVGLCYTNDHISMEQCLVNDNFPNAKSQLLKCSELLDAGISKCAKMKQKLEKKQKQLGFEDILKISEGVELSKQYLQEIEEKKRKLEKMIEDIDAFVTLYSNPKVSGFKEWGINEIIFWIMSLEGGKFKKHCKTLKEGFERNQITGSDLPDISRQDLDVSFKIGVFRDRVLLEKHFKKLGAQVEGANDTQDID